MRESGTHTHATNFGDVSHYSFQKKGQSLKLGDKSVLHTAGAFDDTNINKTWARQCTRGMETCLSALDVHYLLTFGPLALT